MPSLRLHYSKMHCDLAAGRIVTVNKSCPGKGLEGNAKGGLMSQVACLEKIWRCASPH